MFEIGSRKFFLLAFTLFLILGAAGQTPTQTPIPALPPSPAVYWLTVASAVAWPLTTVIIMLVFRRPLGDFFRGLAARVTKFSVFKVELELATTTPSTAESPLLDDIRSATTVAPFNDSSRSMLEQAQSTVPADFAVIDIGTGENWITSRLFIAAVMLERMRGAKVFVFVESVPQAEEKFLAVASIAQVRWILASKFPWLEAAWACAYLDVFPASPPTNVVVPNGAKWLPDLLKMSTPPPEINPANGALGPWEARQVVGKFIDSLQLPPVTATANAPQNPGTTAAAPAQVPLQPMVLLRQGVRERANWVTRNLLKELLPQDAFERWAYLQRDAPRMRRTRAVLRRPGPFVALLDEDRRYKRLVNRAVFLEEIAASLGEEPE
jgi:hypothetical protein